MNLSASIRGLRDNLRVKPPAFPNTIFAFALAFLGMVAFTIAGIGGYRSSPAILRSAMVYHPLLLFVWGALLVFTLLNWILNNPLEPQAPDASRPAVTPIQPTGFQRWFSRFVTVLGVLVVGGLVVRPDVVNSTISNIANHFDTEAGKVVANVFNFYFVVVFVGDIALRYLSSPALRTLGRLLWPLRMVRNQNPPTNTPQSRSAHSSRTRKLPRAVLLQGSDYDEWSKVRQIAVDFFVFGVLLVALSQVMRSDFLNAVFAQSRAGGVSDTSPLNAHISDCTVSWFGSRCTPGIHPSHLPTLTVLDLVLALICGAFGFITLGIGWLVQKVSDRELQAPSTLDVTPNAPHSLPHSALATHDAGIQVSRIQERPGEPTEEKNVLEAAIVDVPHGFMRYVFAVIRSMRRVLWPVSLTAAIACIALAAHYSQFYLHALSCEHQLFLNHSANDCGGFHAAPFDVAPLNYRYLFSAIILSVFAALFIIAAVALLEFKWGPNLNQGLQDSKDGLRMLWYWLRILGYFVARIVWPLIPVTFGLAFANGAYKLIAENILEQPPVPLPFAPPGVLTWFALATYVLFRPMKKLLARASRTEARAKVPVAPK